MKESKYWGTLHPFFEDGPVFGRKMANRGFLEALLHADPFEGYHFFLKSLPQKRYLETALQSDYPEMWRQGRFRVGPMAELPEAIAQNSYACFHLSDWVGSFIDLAILRNAFSREIFPITAPVHTLSYSHYGAAFLRHLWPGVSSRDRIIATSVATEQVIGGYFNQLRANYGLDPGKFPAPGVHKIPLGVDAEQFAPPEEKASVGKACRERLGLGEQVLFLSFSRVSYLSKMDFLPIFDAFRRAHELGLAPSGYHFVLAGRMDREDPFKDAVQRIATESGVPFTLDVFPDTPDDARRRELFAAADVFLSPVDNIQETFGLTILEAFAASLPVIASAIDGYKELVDPGRNGFLIPTVGPTQAGATTRLSTILPTDVYHLYLAQQTVVEAGAFAVALQRLGTDPDLRRRMGQAGHSVALEKYGWDKVLAGYLDLWRELGANALGADEAQRLRETTHPALPDYMSIFSDYFSVNVDSSSLRWRPVRLSATGRAYLDGSVPLVVYRLVEDRVDRARLNTILRAAAKAVPFEELARAHAETGQAVDRDFLLLWALKHDLLEFAD